MNWHYFACNHCDHTFRTTIDNPDHNVKCANWEHELFHEISKEDYDKSKLEVHPSK